MRFLSPDLEPKLLTTLREGYSARDFSRDALAGIVALPLPIAFASGVRPEQGLYTAIVGGFLISVFRGSRVQIGGATGAFVVLVAGVIGEFGYQGLALATLMAGCFLVIMALARLGDVIRFIPYPVTAGYMAGIAIIIAGLILRQGRHRREDDRHREARGRPDLPRDGRDHPALVAGADPGAGHAGGPDRDDGDRAWLRPRRRDDPQPVRRRA